MKVGTFGPGRDEPQLDDSAERFASEMLAGKQPRIEEHLERAESTIRPALLRHLVAAEATFRRDAGEAIRSDDYAVRFPELSSEEIERLVAPTVIPGDPDASVAPTGSSVTLLPVGATPASDSQLTESFDPEQPDLGDVGRYRLLRCLGRGTFGQVFEALDPELDRKVALKLPRPGRTLSADAVARFRAEGRVLAKLRHPGLVAVYDAGVTPDGRPYVVSELVNGEDLSARLDREGKLSLSEATRIVAEAAEALAAAHAAGVVHRDVKPANLMLNREGDVRVADFGIALPEDRQEAAKGEILGSPAYMAPEQFTGEAHLLDGRADVWALGIVLYELLTGKRPYASQTFDGLKEEVLHRDCRPVRQLNPKLPPWVEQVLARCLAKRPADRYATASDLAADLRQGQQGFGASRRRRRIAAVVALVSIAAVLAVGATIGFPWNRDANRTSLDRPTPRTEVDPSTASVATTPAETPPTPWLPDGFEPIEMSERVPLSRSGDVVGWNRIIKRIPTADGEIVVPFRLIPQIQLNDPPAFYIMETKVWNDLFAQFAKAEPSAVADSRWFIGATAGTASLGADGEAADRPVVNVRLDEAMRFADWLGGTLPTAAQWDKAAGLRDRQEGAVGPYRLPPGGVPPDVAVGRQATGPLPVGSAQDDISPHGIRDVAGNGWEFTRTTYGAIELPPETDLRDESLNVLRRGRSYAQDGPLSYVQMREPQFIQSTPHHWTSFRVVLEQE